MKSVYPVIMTKENEIVVYIPDFDVYTQGKDEAEAMAMARDAMGLMGIDMEDDGEALPAPTALGSMSVPAGAFATLVDVDFGEYRRRHNQRTVRRNVSLPGWLDEEADRAGINVSAILQQALKSELGYSQ